MVEDGEHKSTGALVLPYDPDEFSRYCRKYLGLDPGSFCSKTVQGSRAR